MIRRLAAATLIPLIILTLTGLSQARWRRQIEINGSVEMGHEDVDIRCHRLLKCCPCSELDFKLEGDILSISWRNVHPGCMLLVMLLLENTGTVPTMIGEPTIAFNPEEVSRHFRVHYMLLGPLRGEPSRLMRSITLDSWSRLNCVAKPPTQLDPGYRLILLILIKFNPQDLGCMGDTVTITVEVNHRLWSIGG